MICGASARKVSNSLNHQMIWIFRCSLLLAYFGLQAWKFRLASLLAVYFDEACRICLRRGAYEFVPLLTYT